MYKIYHILLTVYFIIMLLTLSLISLPILLIIYPFVSQKKFNRITEQSGILLLKIMTIVNIWSIKVTDLRKNKSFNGQYVLVSNHSSYIDTLLMWKTPLYKKFMVAKKFTKIPVFGWFCKTGGHISVDRFDPKTTSNAIDKALQTIKDGSSFVMYPEGTRSSDPSILLPFKTGAFRLAKRANIPILPITIKGAGAAWPVGGLCTPSNIEIIIGEPVYVENIEASIDDVRKCIYQNLK